jgi:hypothetical protein
MTKKKAATRTPDAEAPVVLRLPPELVQRIDALMADVMADVPTRIMLGRLSRSALYRLVLLEGLKVVERRYRRGNG